MDITPRNKELRSILEAGLSETQTRILGFKKQLQELRISQPDPNDVSQANTDRDIIDAELRQLDKNQKAFQIALRRMEQDNYGYCKNETCEVEIPIERLKLVPTTTFCADCLSINERRNKHYA